MKSPLVVITLVIALVLICGCTTTISVEKKAVETLTNAPTITQTLSTVATLTVTQAPSTIATPAVIPTAAATQRPTTQPTTYTPRYAAGEIVRMNGTMTNLSLITKVTQGQYFVQKVTLAHREQYITDGERYIKKDPSAEEMGSACDAQAFDKIGFTSMGLVSGVPVRDQNGTVYGYLEYSNASSMAFEPPSPEKLTGKVNCVLEIWYNGYIHVYSSLGGKGIGKTYSIDGYREIKLGKSDNVFIKVSKYDFLSGTLKVRLKADGVLVAESETDDKCGDLVLGFTTFKIPKS